MRAKLVFALSASAIGIMTMAFQPTMVFANDEIEAEEQASKDPDTSADYRSGFKTKYGLTDAQIADMDKRGLGQPQMTIASARANRVERRQDRREDRQERRQDRREDRQERRQDRREDRQERREDRREDRAERTQGNGG